MAAKAIYSYLILELGTVALALNMIYSSLRLKYFSSFSSPKVTVYSTLTHLKSLLSRADSISYMPLRTATIKRHPSECHRILNLK